MTFGSTFGRVLSPTFQPKSQAAAASSWWLAGGIDPANCIAAYQPIGASDYAASKVNLANPGVHNCTDGSAVAWDASYGWYADVNTKYLVTDIYPTKAQIWSMIVRFSDATTAQYLPLVGTKGHFLLEPNRPDATVGYFSGINQSLLVSPIMTVGVIGIAGRGGYRDGRKESNLIPASGNSDLYTSPIWIFRYQAGASLVSKIQALAVYKSTLTDAQMVSLTNAMNAL